MRGIIEVGRERNWKMLLATPGVSLEEAATTWDATIVIYGGKPPPVRSGRLATLLVVALGDDHTEAGIPSIYPDDAAVGALAARHLLGLGLKHLSIFAYSNVPFAVRRGAGFRAEVEKAGGLCHGGGEFGDDPCQANYADHKAIIAWLQSLPRPCGVFALCDNWAIPVANYCRHLGLRIPEDVALIGVDNDPLLCELSSPPLTSVAIPWREVGGHVSRMVEDHLAGRPVAVESIRVQPADVVARRSTDTLCIDNTQVADAVAWIRRNAHRAIAVDDVLRAVPTYRQRLERQFRAGLGRTVMEEVRRAHVELAKTLLMSSDLPMPEVATRCGFSNATLLGVNFRKELGITPSEFRRRARGDAGTFRRRSGSSQQSKEQPL